MALRKIVEQGDPVLTKISRPVTDFNRRLHLLIDDMIETLKNANGAGLAAPQVGVLRRVCIVMNEETGDFYELINPSIVWARGEEEDLEGCLSVPGKWGLVKRPTAVRVRAQDRNGNWFELDGTGLTARAFCHELEHLDGHLYTEHIDRFLTDEEVQQYMDESENQEKPSGKRRQKKEQLSEEENGQNGEAAQGKASAREKVSKRKKTSVQGEEKAS